MKTLIFDFDGTIADSFATLLGLYGDLMPSCQKLTDTEVKKLRGSSLKQIIKYFKIKPWQIPRLLFKARGLVAKKIGHIKTFPGLAEILKELHDSDHQMFILSSNSSGNIRQFLENNGLETYFDRIYGNIGLRTKASVIKKILKKEKINSRQTAYIGDEQRDITAARRAGVMAVGVGWGFNFPEAVQRAGPDALAKNPKELLKILKEEA